MGAELTLIERHEGTGVYWKNMQVEIDIGANASFKHYRMIEDSHDAVVTINGHVTQAQDSRYEAFTLLTGSKLTRNDLVVAIQGQNAECDLRALNLLEGRQHGDQTYLVEHQQPHCTSNQFVRSV